MTTVVMPTSEQVICAMEVVQDAKYPKTLVKPVIALAKSMLILSILRVQ